MTGKERIHHYLYLLGLCLLAIGVPTSNFLMSLSCVILFANWTIEGKFSEKFPSKKGLILALALLIPFLVHVLWLLNTTDTLAGLDEVRKKLPSLLIPLVIISSKALCRKKILLILCIYSLSVLTCTFLAYFSHFRTDPLHYRQMVWFISHIRFSLNVCMCTILFAYYLYYSLINKKNLVALIAALLICWFLFFLFVLKSYTGIGILLTLFVVFSFYGILKQKSIYKKISLTLFLCLLICSLYVYEKTIIAEYYTPKGVSNKPLMERTKQGNPYTHRNDGMIENGHYINNNICQKELYEAWSKRSLHSLDSLTEHGNPLYATLIRYLNSMGLTKDAEGLSQLSKKDIEQIEKGAATYYASKTSPRYLTYNLLFEHDLYTRYNDYTNSSFYKRVHLWKAGLEIWEKHPFLGIGTGDLMPELKLVLVKNNSTLQNLSMRIHNQYLNYLIIFGFLGTTLIFLSYLYLIYYTKAVRQGIFVCFLLIASLSMLTEDTLETLAGMCFFFFLFSFLSKNEINSTLYNASKNQF